MFEVQVANDFASLPRSGPGQGARSHCPSQRAVSPMTLSGPDRSEMAVIRRRYTGISAGSWEMLEKNVSSEKTTDFSFDLKHSQRRF